MPTQAVENTPKKRAPTNIFLLITTSACASGGSWRLHVQELTVYAVLQSQGAQQQQKLALLLVRSSSQPSLVEIAHLQPLSRSAPNQTHSGASDTIDAS